jgi:hypothetical protein
MRTIAVIVFCFCIVNMASQKRKDQNAPFSIRGTVGIPKSVSSKMFHTAFNGVYEANISVNAKILSSFFVGAGYQNSHFQNNKRVFGLIQVPGRSEPYNTRLICHSAFVKFGYDKVNEKNFVSVAVNGGYMLAGYKNVVPDSSAANFPFPDSKFAAPFIQPEFAVNFMTDDILSFSLLFSYTTVLTKFDPKLPRFNDVERVRESPNNYLMSWINLGFGFNIMLGK